MFESILDTVRSYGPKLTEAMITFLIGIVLIKVVLKLTKRWLKKGPMDEVTHVFMINIVKIFLWVILLIAVLGTADIIKPASMVAVLGAVGAALALALKDSLANFAGGISIMFHQPFAKGDVIDDLTVTGIVDHIDLLYTTVMTYDNKVVTIPNGKLANNTVINYTKLDLRRVDCCFGISYESDIPKAKELMLLLCKEFSPILSEPEPFAGVAAQNESSIVIDLKCWCKTEDYWTVKYYIEENVKNVFDKNDIIIPYNRVDVNIIKQTTN